MNDPTAHELRGFEEHPEGLLEAYIDGELDKNQARMVESHLSTCRECRRRVDEMQALSSMLEEWQPALTRFSEEVFLKRLAIQLREYPQEKSANISSAATFLWRLLPIILLFGLVFLYSVQVMSAMIGLIPGVDQFLLSEPGAISAWIDLPGTVQGVIRFGLDFSLIEWSWLNGIIAIFALGLAYVGWLSTWWVSNRQNCPG